MSLSSVSRLSEENLPIKFLSHTCPRLFPLLVRPEALRGEQRGSEHNVTGPDPREMRFQEIFAFFQS
jgi:hypothetical protein